jgi:hypothetical protein
MIIGGVRGGEMRKEVVGAGIQRRRKVAALMGITMAFMVAVVCFGFLAEE